jgi:hypothetical protein
MKYFVITLISLALWVQAAAAKPPLRDVAEVERDLLVIGQADGIRRNCPSIEPRRVKVVFFVRGLEKRARNLGYSADEIKEYTKSAADKKRLRAKAASLLAAKGVETSDPQSYCAVGMTEIQKSSQIGSLLRAK